MLFKIGIAAFFAIITTPILLFIFSEGCPVDEGDRVIHLESGKQGSVRNISREGGMTKNCNVAVLFDDGTWSGGRMIHILSGEEYKTKYSPAWEYEKL